MTYLLILTTSLLFALQTLSMKRLRAASLGDQLPLNAVFMGLGAVLLGIYGLFFERKTFVFSLTTTLYGVIFGLLYAAAVLCYLLALNCGPVAPTAFFLSASMLIPALFGAAFLGESMSPKKVVGIILLIAAMALNQPNEKSGAKARGWMSLCLMAFLFNGLLSVCQKCQQTVTHGAEGGGLMLVGYACAAFFSALFGLSLKGKRSKAVSMSIKENACVLPAIAAFSLLGNLLLTHLAASVDSVVLYPMSQGGLLVILTLLSILHLKEKNSVKTLVGLFIGLTAIVMMA